MHSVFLKFLAIYGPLMIVALAIKLLSPKPHTTFTFEPNPTRNGHFLYRSVTNTGDYPITHLCTDERFTIDTAEFREEVKAMERYQKRTMRCAEAVVILAALRMGFDLLMDLWS